MEFVPPSALKNHHLLLGGAELEPIATSTLRRTKKPVIENKIEGLEPIATSTLRREKKAVQNLENEPRVQSPFNPIKASNHLVESHVSTRKPATPVRSGANNMYVSPQPTSNLRNNDNVLMKSTGSETKKYLRNRADRVDYQENGSDEEAPCSDEEDAKHSKPKRKRSKRN